MTDSSAVKGEIKTCLVFPPQWLPINPHFSICSLPGYLRSRDLPVKVIDLNAIFYRTVFTQRHLQYSIDKILNAYDYLQTRIRLGMARYSQLSETTYEVDYYSEIENKIIGKIDKWQEISVNIEKTVSIFDDQKTFYNPFKLTKALITLDKALELVSLPYYPTKLTLENYITPQCPLTLEHLMVFTKNRKQNLFIPFLMGYLAKMLKENVDLYGISINSANQVIPGLTLARLLRENSNTRFHVNIGGSYFAGLRNILFEKPEFFRTFADSVTTGQWDGSFLQLADCLKNGTSLENVPDLLYMEPDERKTVFTFKGKSQDVNKTYVQDLSGLDTERYFAPGVIIPSVLPDNGSVGELIEEWKTLNHDHGISDFTFTDKMLSPDCIEKLSQRILKEKLNVNWFCSAIPDAGFTGDNLNLFHNAGLKLISWKMESGSTRFFEMMNQSVNLEERIRVLNDSARSGIWNLLSLLQDFPGETREDSTNTVNMLQENKNVVHSYVKNIFTISKNSKNLENIRELSPGSIAQDREEFYSCLHFNNLSGSDISRNEAQEAYENFKMFYLETLDEPLWKYLRFKELLYLYIKKYGVEHIRNFRFSAKEKSDLQLHLNDDTGTK
jgi:anaerobic magnesium-protoporphyrin IX monomethyl ester cyclase